MKKRWIIPILAVAVCLGAAGCSKTEKGSVEQGDARVFPVSTYEDTLSVSVGDVMPFYDDGVMNIYHLRNSRGSLSMFYHPIARLTTSDFVHYDDKGISLDFVEDLASPDASLGTGSVIKDGEGRYHFFYTGHNPKLEHAEVIRHAVSADQESWQKLEDFNLKGDKENFRDPYVYYDGEDELYYMLVTVSGAIRRYSAPSLDAKDFEWKDEGDFYINDAGSYNMECPSYLEYNGYYYLAFSEQGDNRVTHYRYQTEKGGEWKKFARDSIDGSGFYAGRLEKTENGLYAFAWCANLSGGSVGEFDWSGSLVAHKLVQRSDGELTAVMIDSVRNEFSAQVPYSFSNGDDLTDISFNGEKFASRSLEKLSENITRIRFTVELEDYGGDFGVTFGLDGAYDNRLAQAVIAFEAANNRLVCYNEVSSIIRYGSPLSSVSFVYSAGKEYEVEIIIEGEIFTVYLDRTVAMTARVPNIEEKHFAFYSNGAKARIREIAFYE